MEAVVCRVLRHRLPGAAGRRISGRIDDDASAKRDRATTRRCIWLWRPRSRTRTGQWTLIESTRQGLAMGWRLIFVMAILGSKK
jgi:hypothetical protein